MYYLIVGVVYITFCVGMTVGEVGDVYEGGTYTWELPVFMLLIMGVPFIAGYLAGRGD